MLWHKCPTHRDQGMVCKNLKVLAGTIRRQHTSVEAATKRRTTVAANSSHSCKPNPRNLSGQGKCAATIMATDGNSRAHSRAPSVWEDAAAKLATHLANTALRIKAMPPDGDCFYHAVSQRLSSLGHNYSVQQLKTIAGATNTDEAEECHINTLISTPVPLYVQFVPVDINATQPVLLWEAATHRGEPSSPPLSLVHWTRDGDGVHFDVLEFVRNISTAASGRANLSCPAPTSCAAIVRPTKRGRKRAAPLSHPPRILYKWVNGRPMRIRDEHASGSASVSLPDPSNAGVATGP